MNPDFSARCYLLKNGVPFHVVFDDVTTLTEVERMAMTIRFGMIDGGKFDWSKFEWMEG